MDSSQYVDETDCEGKRQDGGDPKLGVGAKGNKCHYECSGNGMCASDTGICTCNQGWRGPACNRHFAEMPGLVQ